SSCSNERKDRLVRKTLSTLWVTAAMTASLIIVAAQPAAACTSTRPPTSGATIYWEHYSAPAPTGFSGVEADLLNVPVTVGQYLNSSGNLAPAPSTASYVEIDDGVGNWVRLGWVQFDNNGTASSRKIFWNAKSPLVVNRWLAPDALGTVSSFEISYNPT